MVVRTDPIYQERKSLRYVSVLEKLRNKGLSHYGKREQLGSHCRRAIAAQS
jgi:hypothetical protein